MRRYRWVLLVVAVGSLLVQGAWVSAQQPRPENEISKLAEGVYLYRHQFHQAMFITTPQGVIVTDPISVEAATWLKAEIKALTDQPVRYVIYSHNHNDHITGGSVFADQARFVGHAAAREKILRAADPTTPVPEITFTDRMSIDLGGTQVDLIYTGKNHSDNSLVLLLPQHKVLFAVDFIPVDTVAYRALPDAYQTIGSNRSNESSNWISTCWFPATARSAGRNTSADFAITWKTSGPPCSNRCGKGRPSTRPNETFGSPHTNSGSSMPNGFRRTSRACTDTCLNRGRNTVNPFSIERSLTERRGDPCSRVVRL